MIVEIEGEINYEVNTWKLEFFNEFPVIDSNTVTYNQFFRNFILKNQACLIKNISHNWESTKLWVENCLPNFSYLESHYGITDVNVQDCNEKNYYSDNKVKWKFQDYLKYWRECIKNGYPRNMPLYYLKDWHLKNESPNDNFYEVPIYFSSDWLNEYLVENSLDDYRFVYMGPKGTWSPFHVDVMTSYSWSTNICGQKRWVLFPPGEEDHLRDSLGNLPHDVSNLQHERIFFEIMQNPGDAIFVPTNWHHQVWNSKDTISINHNWINGCNLKAIWDAIEKNLLEVKNEIKDCQDMENFLDHCQVMLGASFGLDFIQFYKLISYIACKRMNLLNHMTEISLPENRKLGKNHAVFDLCSIKSTLALLIKHKDVGELSSFENVSISLASLMSNIETTLSI